jgi:broad specificity phosphatase PhoE
MFPGDEPLDLQTLAEVEGVSWKAQRDVRVLVAPEQRARQTAEALGLVGAETSELRDCDFGRWRGRSLEELQVEELTGLMEWLSDVEAAPHGGESFYNLMIRVGMWLDSQREGGQVVAITHASVIRAAVVHALQLSPDAAFMRLEVAPLTMTDIRLTGGSWRVRSVGVPLVKAKLD